LPFDSAKNVLDLFPSPENSVEAPPRTGWEDVAGSAPVVEDEMLIGSIS
jgi:hypothetical protein